MQSGRHTAAAARRLLLLAVAGSIAVAAVTAAGYLSIYSELKLKSELASQREAEIKESAATIQSQKLELESKSAELAALENRAESLSNQLGETQRALGAESEKAKVLEAELAAASEQAALLSTEIITLRSEVQATELQIKELTEQAAKRVTISHFGLGVDQQDHGTVFPIRVEIIESGSGILSVDINNVEYEPGFQAAVRAAASAASQYTGESISNKDIIVRFAPGGTGSTPNLVKVDGSSAGAIIATMIAAGLSDKQISNAILVTGSIADDGKIGRIGGLEAKVLAADEFGAEALLVPASQEFESEEIAVIGVSDIGDIMEILQAS